MFRSKTILPTARLESGRQLVRSGYPCAPIPPLYWLHNPGRTIPYLHWFCDPGTPIPYFYLPSKGSCKRDAKSSAGVGNNTK